MLENAYELALWEWRVLANCPGANVPTMADGRLTRDVTRVGVRKRFTQSAVLV